MKTVTYRSRVLTDTKTRYSELEKEAKGCEMGCACEQDLLAGLKNMFKIDTSKTVSIDGKKGMKTLEVQVGDAILVKKRNPAPKPLRLLRESR